MDGEPPADGPRDRLGRSAGDRDRPADAGRRGRGAVDPTGSPARAVVSGSIAAAVALVVFLVFAGPLSFSAGLVVIAVFAGRLIGLVVRSAAGPSITSDGRIVIALLITIAWFVLGQLGVWLYARAEGGALGPIDYLIAAHGPLVPLELLAAVGVAWWSAR